jgi:hypothetical protein
MSYDAFIVYSDLGHNMSGAKGVREIRSQRPDAYIIGVSYRPYADAKLLPAGADAFLLRAGNEIQELVKLVQDRPARQAPAAAQKNP